MICKVHENNYGYSICVTFFEVVSCWWGALTGRPSARSLSVFASASCHQTWPSSLADRLVRPCRATCSNSYGLLTGSSGAQRSLTRLRCSHVECAC